MTRDEEINYLNSIGLGSRVQSLLNRGFHNLEFVWLLSGHLDPLSHSIKNDTHSNLRQQLSHMDAWISNLPAVGTMLSNIDLESAPTNVSLGTVLEVKVWNPPYFSSNMNLIDGINASQTSYWAPKTKEFKTRVNPGTAGGINAYFYTRVRNQISPLVVSADSIKKSVPQYLRDILPVPLVPQMRDTWNTYLQTMRSNFSLPTVEGIANRLCALHVHFSDNVTTPVAFIHPSEIIDHFTPAMDLETRFSAIKIRKIKAEFSVETITLREYLESPNTYIVIMDLPKQFVMRMNNYNGVTSLVRAPTVVIPAQLIESKGENVIRSIMMFLDAFISQSFESLVMKEKYKEVLAKYPQLTKHWDGILQACGTDVRKLDSLLAAVSRHVTDTPDVSGINSMISQLVTSPVFASMSSIIADMAKVEKQLRDLTLQRDQLQREKYNHDLQVRQLANQLDQERQASNLAEKNLTGVYTAIVPISEQQNNMYKTRHEATKKLDELVIEPKPFVRNLMFTGLVLKHPAASATFDLTNKDQYDQALTYIKAGCIPTVITAETDKPSIIYVDCGDKPIEKCEQIVGGPYRVRLSYDPNINKVTGFITLKSLAGVFGIKPISEEVLELKQHPHSQPIKVRKGVYSEMATWLSMQTSMCFGEAEPLLAKACSKCDLETIRVILDRWITSAWSKDQWGSQWAWFPHPSKVTL
jgi:hypothetical protein